MVDMGERMSAELRSGLHETEVQLSHWVAEREQKLSSIQASSLYGRNDCSTWDV